MQRKADLTRAGSKTSKSSNNRKPPATTNLTQKKAGKETCPTIKAIDSRSLLIFLSIC